MTSYPRSYTPRGGNGQFIHQPYGRPPVSPSKALMFTDENEQDTGRVIDDCRWRAVDVRQAELLFDSLVLRLTSGAETARPALYSVGQVYAIQLGGTVRIMVTLVQDVGTRWHYRVALLDKPGAKTQLFQTQLVALCPVRLYRGYETEGVDSDWPAEEAKDHSKVS